MLNRRSAPLLLGALFIAAGVAYAVVQGRSADLTGVVALIALGIAMAFTFVVLLDGPGLP
jgi:hypothetical protein